MRKFRRGKFGARAFVFLCLGTALMISLLSITGHWHPRLVVRDLGYLTRPIWDMTDPEPKVVIPHFQADSLQPAELCELHGWKPRELRKDMPQIKVIDAVIFSIELDLLEVRLRELWDVVDIFVVIEADRTFTGKPKPLFLLENIQQFAWAQEKILHFSIQNELNARPQSNFENEVELRRIMTEKIRTLYPQKGDLIISSDVDEIPYKSTIRLLKACEGFPEELHLQMRNYLYSFEFDLGSWDWKPHITIYNHGFNYHHHKQDSSKHQLADAGWHCSFCFRRLADFVFKMTSYSHNDRVTKKELLDKLNIQQKICQGEDIFDMFPEAYSFKELIRRMGKIPKRLSTLGIPNSVVENPVYFKFLLPGGCMREDLYVVH